MPKSKSKSNARVALFGNLPVHPALKSPLPLLQQRMGGEQPLRLPDNYTRETAATVLRSEYAITSDANGQICFAENADLVSKSIWTLTGSVAAAAATTTAHPQQAAFLAAARQARMVHMRVEVMYVGAEQYKSGVIAACFKASSLDINSQTLDSLLTGADIEVPVDEGLVVHNTYTQEPRWETPGAFPFMDVTFPTVLFVGHYLPPSTACFKVRVWRYMEFIPKEGDLFEGEQMSEPADYAALAVHGQLAHPSTSFGTLKGAQAMLQRIKSAANAAYHIAQPLASAYVASQARQYLINSMVGGGYILGAASAA